MIHILSHKKVATYLSLQSAGILTSAFQGSVAAIDRSDSFHTQVEAHYAVGLQWR